jgi:precorrin-6B methylase 2
MIASHALRRTLIVLGAAAIAAGVLAQAQTPQQFKPEVGQPGKDVVWVPSAHSMVAKMLEIAKVTPQDHLIDLGSGDGRTVIAAAKLGARALGIEYNPDMVELSKRNAAEAGVSDMATFVKADLFESDFSQATVITMFLLPEINLKLRPALLNLRPGTRIVSNSFTMEDWEADETAQVTEDCSSWCTALLWIVPAKVEGTWQLGQGQLTLTQSFQVLSGTLAANGTARAIANGRLHGDEISFDLGTAYYSGRVTGNTMAGAMKSGGKTTDWKATRTGR